MKDDKKVVKNEVTDRRALLKGLVAGSAVVTGSKALPENWTKPISDAIVLPGHAQTTVGDYTGGDYFGSDNDGNDEHDGSDGDYQGYDYGDTSTDHDFGEDKGTDEADDSDYAAEQL